MTSLGRVLLALLVFLSLLGLARPAAADWASDEVYIKGLEQHVSALTRTASLFEQQRRSLELVEFQFANLQLPLAAPTSSPEQIVKDVLAKAFPEVRVAMSRLPTHPPPDVETWKWRCRLTGAVEEIRWATQLLLQKGLFVLPSPKEPVTLALDPNEPRGTLDFVGHHVRLREVQTPKLPEVPGGPDVLTSRIDPLAQEIRRLRGEIASLRKRVLSIMTFEARVEAMRFVIKHLKTMTRGGRDPFRVFTPLLDLELVRYQTLVHSGAEVTIVAAVPSESAGRAAVRWLQKQRRRGLRHRFARLHPIYRDPPSRKIPLPKGDERTTGGPECSWRLSGARPADLGVASAATAVVAVGADGVEVTGEVPQAPLQLGLQAAASEAGLVPIRDGEGLLLVPREAAARARRSLAEGRAAVGKRIVLRQPPGTVAQALALLAYLTRGSVGTPAAAAKSTVPAALVGKASAAGWLRLLGAALGLRLMRGSGWELRPAAKEKASLQPVIRASRPSRSPLSELTPFAQLQPRLLLTCRGSSRAVLAASGGAPLLVRAGSRIGRARSRVLRVDAGGVTLRWSDAGITAVVSLPFGEPREGRMKKPKPLQPTVRSMPASPTPPGKKR